MNLVRPPRFIQAVDSSLDEYVAKMKWIEDAGVADGL